MAELVNFVKQYYSKANFVMQNILWSVQQIIQNVAQLFFFKFYIENESLYVHNCFVSIKNDTTNIFRPSPVFLLPTLDLKCKNIVYICFINCKNKLKSEICI